MSFLALLGLLSIPIYALVGLAIAADWPAKTKRGNDNGD